MLTETLLRIPFSVIEVRCSLVPTTRWLQGKCAKNVGLAISDKKKLFPGRLNRRNNWFVPAENSGCSAEKKILGIPSRTIPQRRKMLGILYHGTKLEANAWNSILNHSTEEKTTRNSVPWNKNISKHLELFS
jgi:hypothetical protein